VIVPWVVRDSTCRGTRGGAEEWASPNEEGYLRDDNSKIKNVPKSLAVHSPHWGKLNGHPLGTGFVASHIWSKTTESPLLNSFVPNLVWLPGLISKLTDMPGPVQNAAQAMSLSIYRKVDVHQQFRDVVEEAWSKLKPPDLDISLDINQLNFFGHTGRFLQDRHNRIKLIVDGGKAARQHGDQSVMVCWSIRI